MADDDDDDVDTALQRLKSAGLDVEMVQRMAEALAEQKATGRLRNRAPETVERLRAACEAFQRPNTFKVGEIVRWKTGLKNKRTPAYEQPVLVFAVLETPLFDPSKDAGSQYFHESLDLLIGYFREEDVEGVPDEDVYTYWVDSRRFEHVPEYRPEQVSE